jgi:DNA-binding CsgD family transcriptional regulator
MAARGGEGRSAQPAIAAVTGPSGEAPDLWSSPTRSGDLLERDEELRTLDAALADARAGRGRLVVIEARAGRGKSALMAALCERAAAHGMRVLTGRGGEFEREFAFGAIRQVFELVVGEAGAAERERLLAGAAAPAEAILASDATGRGEPGLAALHAIYWLATNLSLERPLLIAVDDLHWLDDPSLQTLDYLGRRLADLPVALVVALRPAEPGASHELIDALRSQPDALPIGLAPLSAAGVAALVSAAVPDAGEDLCAACFEASAGNPFYLRELLASLDGDVTADDVRRAVVPEVGDRILRRIERMGPAAAGLARAMAVIGDGGSLDAAATTAGVAPAEAAAAAARLRRVEILTQEDPFGFVHPLVRRSVYDSLNVVERDRAHAAAAGVLRERGAPPDAVAAHLSRLRPNGSSEVVAGLRAAAQEALRRGAPAVAAAALERCLEEGAPEPSRAVLLWELGELEVAARDLSALEHLEEARTLADDPVLQARITGPMCTILGSVGRWDDLLRLLDDAIEGLGEDHPDLALELQAMRAVALANDSMLVSDYDRDVDRLLELSQGDAWPARALCALLASIWATRGERIDEVRPLVDYGLRDGRLLRERGLGAWPVAQLPVALLLVGETDRALEVAEEVSAIARDIGSIMGRFVAAWYRTWAYVRRGDLVAAEGEVQPVIEFALPDALQMEVASNFWVLSEAIGERREIDGMLAAAHEALEPQAEFARTMAGGMAREVRGRFLLSRGDREAAVEELRAAGRVYTPLGVSPVRATWRTALALALPPDARDEAHALVDEEVALATRSRLPRPLGIALRGAAAVNGRDGEVDTLRRSVELLEGTDARLEHARSLVALGSALRRGRHHRDAREPLMAGLELAHRCGAEGTAARAMEELRATGARPRRPTHTGADALTVSEARVARLVAQGRSNTEVAQELFVSLKTVETHLTRIYKKLGVSGPGARRRLAAALADASG